MQNFCFASQTVAHKHFPIKEKISGSNPDPRTQYIKIFILFCVSAIRLQANLAQLVEQKSLEL